MEYEVEYLWKHEVGPECTQSCGAAGIIVNYGQPQQSSTDPLIYESTPWSDLR